MENLGKDTSPLYALADLYISVWIASDALVLIYKSIGLGRLQISVID